MLGVPSLSSWAFRPPFNCIVHYRHRQQELTDRREQGRPPVSIDRQMPGVTSSSRAHRPATDGFHGGVLELIQRHDVDTFIGHLWQYAEPLPDGGAERKPFASVSLLRSGRDATAPINTFGSKGVSHASHSSARPRSLTQ